MTGPGQDPTEPDGRGARAGAWSPPVSEPELREPRAWERARDRAHAFVLERGDVLAQLRVRALAGETPPGRVTKALVEAGALAHGSPGGLLAALAALSALDQVDQLDAPAVEPALRALVAAIGADGGWGDPGAPLADRLVLTADIAGFLTKSLRLRPRVRDAVEGFLCRAWSPERVKTGEVAPIAAWAHFFSVNDSELGDPILQWCGRELERGFRTRHFDAVATVRVFLRCRAVALPGASLSAAELCEALANEQTEDGGFALSARALAGEPVEAALDAFAALVRLGPAGEAARAGGPA